MTTVMPNSTTVTARSRCPSVGLLMLLSTCDATYFTFAATRAPRHRINLLCSLHTILQYAHLPRQGSIGLDRGPRCLDPTDSRIMRNRRHRYSYGPPAFLRSHGHHRAHVSPTHMAARRVVNRLIEFSFTPAPSRRSYASVRGSDAGAALGHGCVHIWSAV